MDRSRRSAKSSQTTRRGGRETERVAPGRAGGFLGPPGLSEGNKPKLQQYVVACCSPLAEREPDLTTSHPCFLLSRCMTETEANCTRTPHESGMFSCLLDQWQRAMLNPNPRGVGRVSIAGGRPGAGTERSDVGAMQGDTCCDTILLHSILG